MITLKDFYQGRDLDYGAELTTDIQLNANVTVDKANQLLAEFGEDRTVNSGWRPAAINKLTPGSALFSKHMTGQAIDLHDPEGDLDDWCLANPDVLARIGLWQEHPASTKGWCHVQTVAPKSGNRVFYP